MMKLSEKKIKEIAKQSTSYKDFSWNLREATEPLKPISDAKIGEYVKISSKTFGEKTTTQYTSPSTEGKIIKKNPKSVVVNVRTYIGNDEWGKKNMKYPLSAKVSEDMSILFTMMKGKNKETFWESYWKRTSGKKPRKHPSVAFEDIITKQEKRSKRSIAMDMSKTAKQTFGVNDSENFWKWMKHPNRFDIVSIDTKKKRR